MLKFENKIKLNDIDIMHITIILTMLLPFSDVLWDVTLFADGVEDLSEIARLLTRGDSVQANVEFLAISWVRISGVGLVGGFSVHHFGASESVIQNYNTNPVMIKLFNLVNWFNIDDDCNLHSSRTQPVRPAVASQVQTAESSSKTRPGGQVLTRASPSIQSTNK